MKRILGREYALYLNGLAIGTLLVVISILNPTLPGWVGGLLAVVALSIGLVLARPDPA